MATEVTLETYAAIRAQLRARGNLRVAKATYQLQEETARPPAAPQPAPSPPIAPAVAPPAVVQRAPRHLQSTTFHPEGTPIAKATPFVKAADPPPPSQPSPRPVAQRVGTGTSFEALPHPREPALPFQGKHEGANVPGWGVEHFATLSIELYAPGAQRHQVLARYGITEQQYESMDKYWRSVMQSDSAILGRWEKATAEARARLRPSGR